MATDVFNLYAIVRTARSGRRIIVRLTSDPNQPIGANEELVQFPNTVRIHAITQAGNGTTAYFKRVDGVEVPAAAEEIEAVQAIKLNPDGSRDYWALDSVNLRTLASTEEVDDVDVDPERVREKMQVKRNAYEAEIRNLADAPTTPSILRPFFVAMRDLL